MPSKARSASKIEPHGVRKIVGSESRQVNARTQVGNGERVEVWGTRFRTHSVFLNTRQMLNWAQSNYFGRAPLFMLGTLPLSLLRRASEECSGGSGVRRVTPLGLRLHHPSRSHGARAEFQRTADTLICLYSKQAKLMACSAGAEATTLISAAREAVCAPSIAPAGAAR